MARKTNNQNMFNINIHYYEEQLSPFGKKVFNVMVDNWKLEREHKKNISRQEPVHTHTKKVFNFRNSEAIRTETLLPHYQYNSENRTKDTPSYDINSNEKFTQQIPKSSTLIKTIDINNGHSQNIILSNKFINQNNFNRYDVVDSHLHINSLVSRKSNALPLQSNSNIQIHGSHTVEWNDMFDTELITLNVVTNDSEFTEYNNINTNITINDQISNRDDLVRLDNSINETLKGNKQRKNTETTRKKIKKCTDKPKNILRKQNYTKTVKTWLKGIFNTLEDTRKDFVTVTSTEKKTENTIKFKTKEVVQAQLTNKDGVMKFSKPKKLIDNQKHAIHGTVHEKEETSKDKYKTKFVTPMKSQTLVKEIVYEIHILDQNNIQKAFFSDVTDRELIAVLIYRNGFSQLNCHYTDDSCVPEGIMLCIDNMFYYYKGAQVDLLKTILCILENNEVICYDGKNILIYLMSLIDREHLQLNIIDAKIGGSLLDPDNPPDNFKELQKLLDFVPEYTIAAQCPLQKCAWYTSLLKECVSQMKKKLLEHSLWNIFTNLEMRLLPVLAGMEHRGVKVDTQKLKSMEDVLLSKIKTVEQECYKAAGKTFQINSSMQVSAILYDELQLDTKGNVKIRETVCKGAKSTSESMLRSLVSIHPLPKLILEYRHLHKAHSTFLAGIAHYVKEGVVNSTWEQSSAATGRIASNNPNLQAIPKAPFSLNVFPGTNIVDTPLLNFRSVYIPRDGYIFLAADFKHVECRVFAHAAADTALLALLTDGQDLFKALAVKWLDKSEADVTSEDRERTKRIVYASLYGAGPRKLMDILGISYEQTLAVIASFNRTFPSLKSFGRSVIYRCEQNGGRLSTVCGRVRRFNNITSSELTVKSQAERQAINFIVQGSAADLCKMAMVMTNHRLKNCYPHLEAHLVLQIHDELVWEVRVQDLEKTAVIIKEVMENCGRECGMNVTLPVSVSFGSSWGDITELTLPK